MKTKVKNISIIVLALFVASLALVACFSSKDQNSDWINISSISSSLVAKVRPTTVVGNQTIFSEQVRVYGNNNTEEPKVVPSLPIGQTLAIECNQLGLAI